MSARLLGVGGMVIFLDDPQYWYKTMKKPVNPPGRLADIATLIAIAENFLDILEEAEPAEPRIWKRPIVKRNKTGEEKTYYRWYCYWHDGKKTVRVYLGSCMKMSESQALEKAKRLKAESSPDAEMLCEQRRWTNLIA